MVVEARKTRTVAEFDQFVALPENADRQFEYSRGEIIEVVSNNYSSEIAMIIGAMLLVFVKKNNLGRVTGAGFAVDVADDRTSTHRRARRKRAA